MSDATDPGTTPTGRDASWVDREAYPFESRYLDLPAGTVHYVDEGPADGGRGTLLMLHGNPTWSFLYRHLIDGLRDEYRCVALDYLGFGLSERPPGFSYRPEAHAAVLAAFVEALDLTDLTLVVQDWGGPIGLSYALDRPANVRAIVAMNTWFWPADGLAQRAFSWLFGGPIGRRLCERYNAFARYVVPLGFADRSRLSAGAHRQYLAPFPTPADRRPTWVFPREIVGERDWLADLWRRRSRIDDRPTLLVWGTADPAFGDALDRWREAFPDATVRALDGVGHFVQEEAGPDLVAPVREFLAGLR